MSCAITVCLFVDSIPEDSNILYTNCELSDNFIVPGIVSNIHILVQLLVYLILLIIF